jgi:uncharacterized protein YdeI (YjbR/CyaY-like superfamily)
MAKKLIEKQEPELFYPKSTKEWRKWLEKNHVKKDAVWLMYYKKATGKPSITWSESVDVALCFGWIDSKHVGIDQESSKQYFCKRKAKSTWSKINKQKIEKLSAEGLITEAGFKSIEIAKDNGSWTLLDDVDNLVIPPDLALLFKQNKTAIDRFEKLSLSAKKVLLYKLKSAKRPETRRKVLDELSNSRKVE